MKKTEEALKTLDSIELDEREKRKHSIMSFGDDQKDEFNLKEQTPSLQDNVEKITLKRKNSLDQVHK